MTNILVANTHGMPLDTKVPTMNLKVFIYFTTISTRVIPTFKRVRPTVKKSKRPTN